MLPELPDRYISAETAARWTGEKTPFALVASVPGSTISRVSVNATNRLIDARRTEARARVTDPVALAMSVRRTLWPIDPLNHVKGQRAMAHIGPTAFALFGPHAIRAAAMYRTTEDLAKLDMCRHCKADQFFRVAREGVTAGGGIPPNGSAAIKALLGEPCGGCSVRYADNRRFDEAARHRGAQIIREDARKAVLAASAHKAAEAREFSRLAQDKFSEAGALAASAATPEDKERVQRRLTGARAAAASRAFAGKRAS